MSDIRKKFHEFALKSILFKGRSDWYFCYLKSERIAHVLVTLLSRAPLKTRSFENVVHVAGQLPHSIVHFVAGEMDVAIVLADIFSILSSLRLCGSEGSINEANTMVLVEEYELLAQKLATGSHLSPFISSDDFSVGALPTEDESLPLIAPSRLNEPSNYIKDNNKGHIRQESKGHSELVTERMSLILNLIKKHKKVSIKDISAIIKDCSEKTIQRELGVLIEKGLVRKEGERRWSHYFPV